MSSIRLILGAAAKYGFRLFSHDIKQAYLQSKDKLTCSIFIRPKEEHMKILSLSRGELLELTKPLYRLCDSGDYWGVTTENHLCNDLGMSSMLGDDARHFKIGANGVKSITGRYSDNTFNAGDIDLSWRSKIPRNCSNINLAYTITFIFRKEDPKYGQSYV